MGSKSPEDERHLIETQPTKRPYGARICLHLQTTDAIGGLDENVLRLSTGEYVTLTNADKAPWEGGEKVKLEMLGYASATDAERRGNDLVAALYWAALKLGFPARVEHPSPGAVTVFDRRVGPGMSAKGYGTTGWPTEKFFEELPGALSETSSIDPRTALSMEISAGAALETSERARFLACVSALEPLAAQASLGEAVDGFVDECLERLSSTLPPSDLKVSLAGRIRHLRQESVRQAIKRVIRETFPDETSAFETVDRAYGLRSELVHEGRLKNPDVDLAAERGAVTSILKDLYAFQLGRSL